MKTTIRRLALAASCAAALSALTLATAGAASGPTPVTGDATNVTASSATLHGQLNTGGQTVSWEFEYGRTTAYGSHTPVRSTSSSGPVSEVITGLTPGVTYHYQLVDAPQGGAGYGTVVAGGDRTFTTTSSVHAGSLRLRGGKLAVKHGKVSVPLRCAGSRSCKGKLTIKHGSTRCVSGKRFSVGAGASKTLRATVSGACRGLLRRSRSHRLGGTLNASMSSGQPNLSRGVTLVGK